MCDSRSEPALPSPTPTPHCTAAACSVPSHHGSPAWHRITAHPSLTPLHLPLPLPSALPRRLAGSPLQFQYIPQLQPGSRALVDALWPLYLQNGERHGFHVLSRANFYRIHLSGHQGLGVLLVRVRGFMLS